MHGPGSTIGSLFDSSATKQMTAASSQPELNRFLDGIVDLTRHRDPQALTEALLHVLRENVPAECVRLLMISNHQRDNEFDEHNTREAIVYDALDAELDEIISLTDDPDLLECVLTQAPVTVADKRRVVLPVFGVHHVCALVVIDGVRDTAIPQALIAKLLRVYGNQTFMLSRSRLDPLTGLYNRQTFYERIRQVAQHNVPHRRAGDAMAVSGHCFALFDIDNFKQVNDMYGHLYGDEVLVLLARLMSRSFRHEDALFRYGGEEFAAVLVNVDLDSAGRLLERFRVAVEAYHFPQLGPKTVSIGYTVLDPGAGTDAVVMRADKALYYAKQNGRNRSCCYEALIAAGELTPVEIAEGDIELF